ncbi:hypothetical protein BGX30_006437 [Mortierella sp. GBA39]|nr:hypothetical protein BGX30_006437 [Mortierella sp. GBA39]
MRVTLGPRMHHVPSVSRYNKKSFYFPEIFYVSSEAADYIASLGHTFVVDWDKSTLYIAYDTIEILIAV